MSRNGYLYNPTRYRTLRGGRDCGDFEATVNEFNQPTEVVTISETEVQEAMFGWNHIGIWVIL